MAVLKMSRTALKLRNLLQANYPERIINIMNIKGNKHSIVIDYQNGWEQVNSSRLADIMGVEKSKRALEAAAQKHEVLVNKSKRAQGYMAKIKKPR